MTRIICVGSGKGGVGKTTMVANLSAALAKLGKNVVAVDSNTTTSNLGLHLGIPLYPVTLQDVLKRRASIIKATYRHAAGFRVIPADVSLSKLMLPKTNSLLNVFYKLRTDFVIIDSAAGLGQEAVAAVEAADELITVVNPNLQSLTDALKLIRISQKLETTNTGVVINMIRNEPHEFSAEEVEDFLGVNVIGLVPEDRNVRFATAQKQPVVTLKPRSKASKEIMRIAARLAGEELPRESFMDRLFGWLGV